MLKQWQFDLLFYVAVGGTVFLLFAPSFGLPTSENPATYVGIGSMLTFVLSQRKRIVKNDDGKEAD